VTLNHKSQMTSLQNEKLGYMVIRHQTCNPLNSRFPGSNYNIGSYFTWIGQSKLYEKAWVNPVSLSFYGMGVHLDSGLCCIDQERKYHGMTSDKWSVTGFYDFASILYSGNIVLGNTIEEIIHFVLFWVLLLCEDTYLLCLV